jgi:ribonucleoside-diphosphate reductase alpha chain
MFLDDTACNLASMNLLPFRKDGSFDVEAYEHHACGCGPSCSKSR